MSLSMPMTRTYVGYATMTVALLALIATSGCTEPDSIGRFRATPVTTVILDSLGVGDEPMQAFAGARPPAPRDMVVDTEEYVIGPGDVLDISVFELFSSNMEWVGRKEVSATGRITLPVIGTLTAVGRTELEFTQDIVNVLSPTIIRDPQVSVVVVASRERVFAVSGAVAAPGQYALMTSDFRLADALALAGGAPQANVDYIYVLRRVSPEEALERHAESAEAAAPAVTPLPAPPMGTPAPTDSRTETPTNNAAPEPRSPAEEREQLLESIEPLSALGDSAAMRFMTENAPPVYQGRPLEVVQDDGGFRLAPRVDQPRREAAEDFWRDAAAYDDSGELRPPLADAFGDRLDTLGGAEYHQEIIRVAMSDLRNGNHNIVIKAGDGIHVPLNAVGVYHVMGQVARPGPYSLAGDRQTLKQVIAGAGPLTPLAWPSRTEIVRRVSENREITYAVNLEMLFAGSAPDVFIRPNDIINVGTHPVARWVAVVRQSFRSTYGFGFVYDRNFADKDFGN